MLYQSEVQLVFISLTAQNIMALHQTKLTPSKAPAIGKPIQRLKYIRLWLIGRDICAYR